jgi:hypothetical protein
MVEVIAFVVADGAFGAFAAAFDVGAELYGGLCNFATGGC